MKFILFHFLIIIIDIIYIDTRIQMEQYIQDVCGDIFPQVLPSVERIIAIGDVHGDYDYLIHLLKMARVIDNNEHWIGGNTYIVQVGDQIDNCRPNYSYCNDPSTTKNDKAEDTKIINYLEQLHQEAVKNHGAVISLLGNHEFMNITGDLSYVSYKNIQEFNNVTGRKKAFSKDGKYGRKLICTHPAAIIIGRNLFVHAGILPKILETMPELRKILTESVNDEIENMKSKDLINFLISRVLSKHINKEYLYKLDAKRKVYWENLLNYEHISTKKIIKILSSNTEILQNLIQKIDEIKKYLKDEITGLKINELHPIEVINTIIRRWLLQKINIENAETVENLNSVFWTRILGNIPNELHKNADHQTCDKYLQPVLKILNINHMIVGHTPQFQANQSGMNTACDESLVRIDIGGAEVFNLYDTNAKDGERMKQRIPQVLEILNDEHIRILYDEKATKQHGGKIYNLFKKNYSIM